MDKQLINEASNKLNPIKVLLSGSNISSVNNIKSDIKNSNFEVESFKSTTELIIDEISPEDEEKNNSKIIYMYNYFYDLGVRGVIECDDKKTENESEKGPNVLFEITARFKVIYSSKEKLDKSCSKEFGKFNVGHTVWPYWREYVQNTCQRLGIETLEIPFYKIQS